MTVLVLGGLFLVVIVAMRLTFWFLHVTTDRSDDQ